jgi:hypothetical protein
MSVIFSLIKPAIGFIEKYTTMHRPLDVKFIADVTFWPKFINLSFSILSDDRFKASSKTIPPHSAI